MFKVLSRHWPEYLMEAAGLGLFMISACVFATLLEYPGSPVCQAFPDPVLRRLLMGLAMAATAIGIVYSPWGKQSGAHINPSITLTFWYLGKIEHWDALFYVVAQFLGAVTGTALVALVLGRLLSDTHVNYVVTMPGMAGATMAFAVETGISFLLMTVVLISSNNSRFARFTSLYCAGLVALYITLAAPFSGMSMNPARSFGSAFVAQQWAHLWIYFLAPTLGMRLAAEVFRCLKGLQAVKCCKLHHDNDKPCPFRCNYQRATPPAVRLVTQP